MGHRTPSALLLALLALLAVTAGCNGALTPDGPDPEDDEARAAYYEQAAKTYYDGGKYQSSARMWEKVLELRPNDQWGEFGMAKALQMMGTPQSLRRAETLLETAASRSWIHPTRGDIRFEVLSSLAAVYSKLADFYDRDIRMLDDRLANDASVDTALLEQQMRTQTANRDQLLHASLPLYEKVLASSPDNHYALAGLAKAHLIAGNEDIGIGYAESYIDLSKRSQVGWRKLQREWEQTARKAGRPATQDERAHFRTKIRGAREKEKGMLLLLGSVYMRRENFSEAVLKYNEVLELDSALPAPYAERAQAYAALGLYSRAVKDLEVFLKMTDPVKHRLARVNAATLLDRYRRIEGQAPILSQPGATPRPPRRVPQPVAPAQPVPPRRGDAYGSPDGPPAGTPAPPIR